MAEDNTDSGEVYPAPTENSSSSKGQPLEPSLRHELEANLNQNLSQITVHVGHEATLRQAKAFTHGDKIYLAPGTDFTLSSHEAAHLVQQGGAGTALASGLVRVSDRQRF